MTDPKEFFDTYCDFVTKVTSDPSLDIASVGNQRGNARDRDYIYTFGISIMRYFGQLPCPKVSKKK